MILLTGADEVRATTVVSKSVEEMTALATDVVIGTCSKVRAHWTGDRKQILTYVTLSITDALKGDTANNLTFVQLGGRVEDMVLIVVGAPTFEEGEEVVVFLTRMKSKKRLAVDTDLWLVGLDKGKWQVTREPNTGVATATSSVGAQHLVTASGKRTERTLPLENLIARVKHAASAIKAGNDSSEGE